MWIRNYTHRHTTYASADADRVQLTETLKNQLGEPEKMFKVRVKRRSRDAYDVVGWKLKEEER